MHPDAAFIIIVVLCLAAAVLVIAVFLRRHARAGSERGAA